MVNIRRIPSCYLLVRLVWLIQARRHSCFSKSSIASTFAFTLIIIVAHVRQGFSWCLSYPRADASQPQLQRFHFSENFMLKHHHRPSCFLRRGAVSIKFHSLRATGTTRPETIVSLRRLRSVCPNATSRCSCNNWP